MTWVGAFLWRALLEKHRSKYYISEFSRDVFTQYEFHSLPWEVLPSFRHALSILACSYQDVLFLNGPCLWKGKWWIKEGHHTRGCERNFIGPKIAVLLSKYTCSGDIPPGGWFPSDEGNYVKVTSLLTAMDVWLDWKCHSLLWAHLWCLLADFKSDMLCVHTSAIISKFFTVWLVPIPKYSVHAWKLSLLNVIGLVLVEKPD